MDRRAFLGTLAGGLLAAPLAAEAQQAGKVWRIGLLSYAASDSGGAARWKAFREQLRELGTWRDRTYSLSQGGETGRWAAFEVWPPS
jgi:ABC-type sugar transport system substrate-binding protein